MKTNLPISVSVRGQQLVQKSALDTQLANVQSYKRPLQTQRNRHIFFKTSFPLGKLFL